MADEHEWARDPRGIREGLACVWCSVTEAEVKAAGGRLDQCRAPSSSFLDRAHVIPERNALTDEERRAITSLHRLAKRWPSSLTLISMGGGLHVIRTGDPLFGHDHGSVRAEAIIDSFTGIPNDGGDW